MVTHRRQSRILGRNEAESTHRVFPGGVNLLGAERILASSCLLFGRPRLEWRIDDDNAVQQFTVQMRGHEGNNPTHTVPHQNRLAVDSPGLGRRQHLASPLGYRVGIASVTVSVARQVESDDAPPLGELRRDVIDRPEFGGTRPERFESLVGQFDARRE